MTLKVCPLIECQLWNIFIEKSCRKYAPKASPRPKLTLFFRSNPVSYNGQSYQIQKGSGTSDLTLFRIQVQKNSFIRYILSDQV